MVVCNRYKSQQAAYASDRAWVIPSNAIDAGVVDIGPRSVRK